MRTGRDEFRKNVRIINAIIFIMKKIPNKFLHVLWNITNGWKGKLGIGIRYCILKVLCKDCGTNVYVAENVEIKNMKNLTIGSNVSIHRFSYIDAAGEISIGNDVSIAHNASLVSFDHTWNDKSIPIKYNPTYLGFIKIEDDVWIGCGVRILKNVTIKSRSIVAAGSIVTKNIESNSISGGVPNKKIGCTKALN
ncbi:MAG: acyltransferase [Paeniclostridium sp.]|nr:acyltransferase [Paeniclostridium sp.]MBW4862843.1 acyltransferase [Paeniclostridium sp.]MBW4873105.1 acyltransferase [Paeniclostridium sp.]